MPSKSGTFVASLVASPWGPALCFCGSRAYGPPMVNRPCAAVQVTRRVWTNLPTAKSSCFVSAAWTHPSAVVIQFTIFLCCWATETIIADKWRHTTSLLKKLSISIKIVVTKLLWSLFGQFLKLSIGSVGSRRELVTNCVHTADADAMQLDSWVASASAVCIGYYTCTLLGYFCWGTTISSTKQIMFHLHGLPHAVCHRPNYSDSRCRLLLL